MLRVTSVIGYIEGRILIFL